MDDTSPHMKQKMQEMMQVKSGAERLRMGCSMFDFSKRLVIHGILEESPHLSALELRKELFLRFYGDEFDSGSKKKVLHYLTQ